jgi:hypothetical protein
MQSRQHFVDEFHAASEAEAELWNQVKGHGPGQPGFNRDLWGKWLEAVGRTNATAKALREAFSESASAPAAANPKRR